MEKACWSPYPSDLGHAACYSWCGSGHCDRCKCRACSVCREPGQKPVTSKAAGLHSPIEAEARATWSRLSPQQRLLQPLALYRTSYPDSVAVGCVGALRQPVASTPHRTLRLRNLLQHSVMAACAVAGGTEWKHTSLPAIFFQEALHSAEGGAPMLPPTPSLSAAHAHLTWQARSSRSPLLSAAALTLSSPSECSRALREAFALSEATWYSHRCWTSSAMAGSHHKGSVLYMDTKRNRANAQ